MEKNVHIVAQTTFSVLCKRVEVRLEKDGGTFGFLLRGGANVEGEKSRPLTITQIRPGSSADRSYFYFCCGYLLMKDIH